MNRLADRLEISGTVLTQGADEVLRQDFALVHIATDLADPTLFLGVGLGLYILKVVIIGHRLCLGQIDTLGHIADEHEMGTQIHGLNDLAGDIGIGKLL